MKTKSPKPRKPGARAPAPKPSAPAPTSAPAESPEQTPAALDAEIRTELSDAIDRLGEGVNALSRASKAAPTTHAKIDAINSAWGEGMELYRKIGQLLINDLADGGVSGDCKITQRIGIMASGHAPAAPATSRDRKPSPAKPPLKVGHIIFDDNLERFGVVVKVQDETYVAVGLDGCVWSQGMYPHAWDMPAAGSTLDRAAPAIMEALQPILAGAFAGG